MKIKNITLFNTSQYLIKYRIHRIGFYGRIAHELNIFLQKTLSLQHSLNESGIVGRAEVVPGIFNIGGVIAYCQNEGVFGLGVEFGKHRKYQYE